MKHKNSQYIDSEKQDYATWWLIVLALLVVSIIVLGATGTVGRIINVVVEREVFEQSYQYSEGLKAEIATYNAQIAELEVQLENDALTDSERNGIEAQLRAINIRLNTALSQQDN